MFKIKLIIIFIFMSFSALSMNQENGNLEKIKSLFHLPLKEAADKYGICPTSFKEECRKFGIARWPYRKIAALKKKRNVTGNLKEIQKLEKMEQDLINNTVQEKRKNQAQTRSIEPEKKVKKRKTNKKTEKPLMTQNIMLYATDFLYTDNINLREFIILDDSSLFTVHLGSPTTCTCKNDIEKCPHLEFIMKRFFHQKDINLTITEKDFILLEEAYRDNATNFDCPMCYTTITHCKNLYFFPKTGSYGHHNCVSRCLAIMRKKERNCPQLRIFLENLKKIQPGDDTPYHYSLKKELERVKKETPSLLKKELQYTGKKESPNHIEKNEELRSPLISTANSSSLEEMPFNSYQSFDDYDFLNNVDFENNL